MDLLAVLHFCLFYFNFFFFLFPEPLLSAFISNSVVVSPFCLNFYLFFIFWSHYMSHGISVSWPRIRLVCPALEVQSLKYLKSSLAPSYRQEWKHLHIYYKIQDIKPGLPYSQLLFACDFLIHHFKVIWFHSGSQYE